MIFKGQDTLTISSEGAIIQTPSDSKQYEKYLKQCFNIGKGSLKKSAAELSTLAKEQLEHDDTPGASARAKYTPKQEDLLVVPFRMLSETIVAGGTWRATDFSKRNVLRRSIPLMVGKPAFTDHMQWADMFVGSVISTSWQSKTTDGQGQPVPAGMNGLFQIDAASNEKLARGLLSTPPSIHSCSVSVAFNWEASHDFESESDFFRHVGEIVNDEMVRRVVTEIVDFYECSIVWMGADPYAKMLDSEGKPMHVDRGSTFDEASKYAKEFYEKEHKMFTSFSYGKNSIYLKSEFTEEHKDTSDMEKLFELIRTALGLEAEVEITQEHLSKVKLSTTKDGISVEKRSDEEPSVHDLQKELDEKTKQIQTLTADNKDEKLKTVRDLNKKLKEDNEELQEENDALLLQKKENEELITLGKTFIDSKKKEAVRLYKLSAGDDADDSIVELFEKASDKQLEALIKQHLKGATEKFGGHCKDCGSKNFDFRSSISTETEGGEAVPDEKFREEFRNRF